MLDKKLSDKIVEKQGNLLFTTLAEECTELAQACCKINRCKYFQKDYINVLENFFEEICDLEINLELIQKQVIKETGMSEIEYNEFIKTWKTIKQEKLKKIFGVNDIDSEYKNLINAGYITEKGEPIKCLYCGSTETEECNHYKEDYYVVEYSKKCSHYKKILGHWAYGYWDTI